VTTEVKVKVTGMEELDRLNEKLLEIRELLKEVNDLQKPLTPNVTLNIELYL
jgi:hypothetical protein